MWKPTGGLAFSSAGLRGAAAGVTCLLTGFLLLLSGTGHPEEPPAAGTGFSAYIRTLTRERRAVRSPRSSTLHGPVEHLSQDDLFIAVKSTRRYHPDRLELLLDTWISRNLPQIYRPPKVARYKEHHLLFGSKVTLEELQRSITQTYVFTDGEDERLEKKMGAHLINTNCSAAHTRQALSCKMALEYDTFLNSAKKWFCHVDDDNYLNVGSLLKLLSQYSHTQDVYIGRPSLERPIEATETLSMTETKQVRFWFATGGAGFCLSHGLALKMKPWASGGTFMATADHIRLPDDCTVGYIVEALLGGCLTRSALFHSHLENLGVVTDIHNQVTLSYGTVENRRNTVHVKGPFSTKEDPTRFRSVHCLLYPDTFWCPSLL